MSRVRVRVRVRVLKSTIIPIVCAFVGVLALAMCIWLYLRGHSKKIKLNSANTQVKESFLKVSYDMLLKATNGFSPETLIGSGTYGSVFKGILDGETVAIKVLNLQQRGGVKSFMAECEALRNIRHRNLVEIITACSSIDFQRNDFKALVYKFMPNILLDHDMVSHVSDFGLAKILAQPLHPNQSSSIGVRGTFGYIAPEYGLGGEVSLAADLYSYGIVLLELMTRKRPTDDMFKEDFNLHMYAKAALPDQVSQIVDVAVFEHETEEADSSRGLRSQEMLRKQEECITVIMNVGVACSNQLPQDRMTISAAINELQKARKSLLNPRRRHNIPRGNRLGHN